MNPRPLIIDTTVRAAMARLVEYAEEHRIDAAQVIALHGDPNAEALGNNVNRHLVVPMGYRVAFTIEEQPNLGWVRHASFSVASPNPADLPSFAAVNELLPLLGFRCKIEATPQALDSLIIYLESLNGEKQAVNVLEKMEPTKEFAA